MSSTGHCNVSAVATVPKTTQVSMSFLHMKPIEGEKNFGTIGIGLTVVFSILQF